MPRNLNFIAVEVDTFDAGTRVCLKPGSGGPRAALVALFEKEERCVSVEKKLSAHYQPSSFFPLEFLLRFWTARKLARRKSLLSEAPRLGGDTRVVIKPRR